MVALSNQDWSHNHPFFPEIHLINYTLFKHMHQPTQKQSY
jgi:hypothetical protein